jgi:prevent-host-death family protein
MLNLAKDIRPISYVKSHTAEMIKQVGEQGNPIVITQNGEAKAVLLDIDSYQKIVDAINMMKIISIGQNDVKNGRVITDDELDKKVRAMLG